MGEIVQNYGRHLGALELWFFWTGWWVSRQLVQRRTWFHELFSVAPSPVLLSHLLSQARGEPTGSSSAEGTEVSRTVPLLQARRTAVRAVAGPQVVSPEAGMAQGPWHSCVDEKQEGFRSSRFKATTSLKVPAPATSSKG